MKIKAERIRDRLSFDVSACRAYIEASQCGVTILMCDHLSYDVEPASLEPDEAVEVLRAMLREVAGPSIYDVREVWESPRATSVHDTDHGLSAQPWHVRVPHPEGGSMIFGGATEREALQAAYDAGVARAKAATVPPS